MYTKNWDTTTCRRKAPTVQLSKPKIVPSLLTARQPPSVKLLLLCFPWRIQRTRCLLLFCKFKPKWSDSWITVKELFWDLPYRVWKPLPLPAGACIDFSHGLWPVIMPLWKERTKAHNPQPPRSIILKLRETSITDFCNEISRILSLSHQ